METSRGPTMHRPRIGLFSHQVQTQRRLLEGHQRWTLVHRTAVPLSSTKVVRFQPYEGKITTTAICARLPELPIALYDSSILRRIGN